MKMLNEKENNQQKEMYFAGFLNAF